jgi:hypothetical protein
MFDPLCPFPHDVENNPHVNNPESSTSLDLPKKFFIVLPKVLVASFS